MDQVTGGPIRVYSKHRCGRRHRSWATLAQCIFPVRSSSYVTGLGGQWLTLTYCRPGVVQVATWDSLAAAERAKARIDRSACGGMCSAGPEDWRSPPPHFLGVLSFDGSLPDGLDPARAQVGNR